MSEAVPVGIRVIRADAPDFQAGLNASAVALVAGGRGSMSAFLGDAAMRARLFAPGLRWNRVLLALDGDRALGYAAFKLRGEGPYAPDFAAFVRTYGAMGAWWRYLAFHIVERRDRDVDFYLYGLKVDMAQRGRGIGGRLVEAVLHEARARGMDCVELEVGENNAGARRLYAQKGFLLHRVVDLGWLGRMFPFARLLVMRCPLR